LQSMWLQAVLLILLPRNSRWSLMTFRRQSVIANLAGKQVSGDIFAVRQTHRQTSSSQYSAPYRGGEVVRHHNETTRIWPNDYMLQQLADTATPACEKVGGRDSMFDGHVGYVGRSLKRRSHHRRRFRRAVSRRRCGCKERPNDG